MNKKVKLSLSSVALATSIFVPVATVFSKQDTETSQKINAHKSIWNKNTIVDQNKTLSDANVQNAISNLANYGNYMPWITKTISGDGIISAIVPNEDGNFWISAAPGTVTTVDAQGNVVSTIENLVDKSEIGSIVSDGNGGFYAAGKNGIIDHVNRDGSIDNNWKGITFLEGQNVNAMLPDYKGGIYIVGDGGYFDHIDNAGKSKISTGAEVVLDGLDVYSMAYGTKSDLVLGGQKGGFARIDFQGNAIIPTQSIFNTREISQIIPTSNNSFVIMGKSPEISIVDESGQTTKTESPFGDIQITSITPVKNDTFMIGNANGQIALIDSNLNVLNDFSGRQITVGAGIASIVNDGFGGMLVTSNRNTIERIDANGQVYGFNSWVIPAKDQQTRYEQYGQMLSKDWQTQTILDYSNVRKLFLLSDGKFFAGGSGGRLNLFNADGSQNIDWKGGNFLNAGDINAIVDMPEKTFAIAGLGNSIQQININGEVINTLQNPLDTDIFQIITDGKNGFIVLGGKGQFAHVDSDFKVITKTDLQGNYDVIVPDGLGNYFIGGNGGQILHVDVDGNTTPNWVIPNLIDYQTIFTMIPDGKGHLLIGGTGGKFAQVDYDGKLMATPNNPLIDGGRILDIIPDGEGNFFVAGDRGSVQKIDSTGTTIGSAKQLIEGQNINTVIPDDQGGFWVAGDAGKLDHFNTDGDSSKAETKEETLARWSSKSKIKIGADFAENDFTFIGDDKQGIVYYSNPKMLPEPLKIQYLSDQNGQWSDVAPANLSNNDIIKARLVVKDDYASVYDIDSSITNPITLTVSGLSAKTVLTTTIDTSKFAFSGTSTESSTVTYSGDLDHLEMLYSVDEGVTWTKSIPTNLKNGDVIKTRLNVLASDADHYVLSPSSAMPIDVTVSGLGHVALSDKLNASDFKFSGYSGSGTIAFSPANALSPQLGVEYQVNGQDWSTTIPTDLKHNDSVTVRLMLKAHCPDVYDYDKTEIPLVVNVPKVPLTDEISNRDFEFSGTTGNGTVIFSPSTPLSDQLEVQYSYDGGAWTTMAPTNLANGIVLKANLKVKSEFENDYEIKSPNQEVTWTIKLEKIPLNYTISPADFTFNGEAKSGTIAFAPQTPLPSQLEVQYSYDGGAWTTTAPTNLANDKSPLLARLVVKASDQDDYRLDPPARENTILPFALNKIMLANPIKDSDFSFTGTAGAGVINFNPSAPIDSHVQIQYSLDRKTWLPINGGDKVSTHLKNGEDAFVRSVIANDEANYDLSNDAKEGLDLKVNGLAKIMLQDKLSIDDFVFSGENNEGTVSLNPNRVISQLLKVQYSKDATIWNDEAPTNLVNGDTLKARLALKQASENYDVDQTPIDLTVKDLPFHIILHDKLTESNFKINGNDGSGKIIVSPNLWLPEQLTIQYSTNNINWSLDAPSSLKNGDTVLARLAFKEKDANGNDVDYSKNYTIENTDAIKISIANLPKTQLGGKGGGIKAWAWALIGIAIATSLVGGVFGLQTLLKKKRIGKTKNK